MITLTWTEILVCPTCGHPGGVLTLEQASTALSNEMTSQTARFVCTQGCRPDEFQLRSLAGHGALAVVPAAQGQV